MLRVWPRGAALKEPYIMRLSISKNRVKGLRLSRAIDRAANFALENLELRRLLSATYNLDNPVYSNDPQTRGRFGANIATHGNLALVAAYQKKVNGVELMGQVELVDTATGTVQRVFDNPSAGAARQFGRGMTFVGDKIAIAAPAGANGAPGRVWVWDDANDATPTEINGTNNGTFFGLSLAAVGNDLLISEQNPISHVGDIARFSTSGTRITTYFDPQNGADTKFGSFIATSGNTIYSTASTTENATQRDAVVGFDATSGSQTALIVEPNDHYEGWHQFGNIFTVSPVTGDVFVGALGSAIAQDQTALYFDGVYQYHADGAPVRLYRSPRDGQAGAELFFMPAVTDTNQLVVGAQNTIVFSADQTQLMQAGSVYVFDAGTGELQATIDNPTTEFDGTVDDQDEYEAFGTAVGALSGGRFIVGDPLDNFGSGFDTGAAYIYAPAVVTPPNQAPTAVLASPAAANENGSLSLDASASTDPDGAADIVSYSWDLNNDNVFGDALGATVWFSRDLSGNYPVSVKVTDSYGNVSTASATAVFNAVLPTASAGNAQNAVTGTTVSFAGSGSNAAGDTIVSYEWDFNYNGSQFNATASGANASTAYAAAGAYVVALRVTDDDGDTVISTTTVTVSNLPPVVTNHAPVAGAITGASTGVSSQVLAFAATYTDEDSAATDPRTVSWNFGDGNVAIGSLNVAHAYGTPGTYTVTFTVTDSHGAASSSQKLVTVTATGIVGNDLYVGGTSGNDTITINRNANNQIVVGNQVFTIGGRVVILAGAGNDVINVGSSIATGLYIDGGDGDDLVHGGHGSDILIGGAGNDTLIGDVGRDLLIGGLGSDVVIGDSGDDIIVGGGTSHDSDPAALTAIMAEWTSGRSYLQRVNNIINGTGSSVRANANSFITPDVTAFDDGAVDSLSGDGGQDWIVYNSDAPFADILTGLQQGELASDVDPLV
ncbi:MAG TPA: PKD domain-containing protein [Tepidisphaeraceae bacterium]|jgi:PKD repeat protein